MGKARLLATLAPAWALAAGCVQTGLIGLSDGDGGSTDGGGFTVGAADAGRDAGCPSGETACGTGCTNPSTDPMNCGACGTACAAEQICSGGQCVCPAGGTFCRGGCTSLLTDDQNCGACDRACAAGIPCEAGACAGGPTDAGPSDGGTTPGGDAGPDDAGTADAGPAPRCGPRQTDCGGVCTDTETDPNNCGGCGFVCPDGTCANWTCPCATGDAGYVVLAADGGQPYDLAVGGTSVYWTDQVAGTVMRVGVNGGMPVTLVDSAAISPSGLFSPDYLALDSTDVYFVNQDDDAVIKVPLVGGAPVTLATGGGAWPFGLAVDQAYAYWAIDTTGEIQKVSLGGGAPVTLVPASSTNQDSTYLAGVDATSVYWSYTGSPGQSNGAILKVGLAGGVPVTLASALDYPIAGAVDGMSVYFTEGFGIDAVVEVPTSGGEPVTLASGLNWARGLAVDGSSVYWAGGNTCSTGCGPSTYNGTVMKVGFGGGPPTVLAACLRSPYDVAVDSTSVYWTDLYGGTVSKVTPK